MNTRYSKYEPIFGSWTIKERIGYGATGEVFLIEREDRGETRRSALKCITIPQSEDEILSIRANGMTDQDMMTYYESVMARIQDELTFLARLQGNSHVVSYEDHMIIPHEQGIGWDILIRLELLTPLLKYCEESPLSENDVLRLGIDMCKALELCSKNGIIHRDIKPENIFVSQSGAFKLGDFGISRMVEETRVGLSRKGTYLYMAPEIFKGEPYGPRSDIYSLGLVLYKYLNGGRNVFMPGPEDPITVDDNDRAFFRRMSGAMLPPPTSGSEKLKAIVLKACSYRPQDRYSSAEEMRKALEDPDYQAQGGEDKVFAPQEPQNRNDSKAPAGHDQPETAASAPTDRRWNGKRIASALAALAACLVLIWYIMLPKEVTDVIGINDTENIFIGETEEFTYDIEPDRFEEEPITFESSDAKVITVDQSGRITGVSVGEADMTLSVKEFTKKVHVNVIPKVTGMKNLKTSISLTEGDTSTLKPKLVPAKFADEPIRFRSSDKEVATVSQKGKIKAKKPGKATITVSAGGCREKVKVTVEEIPEPVVVEPAPVPSYSGSSSGSSGSSSGSGGSSKKKSKKSSRGYFKSGDDQYF